MSTGVAGRQEPFQLEELGFHSWREAEFLSRKTLVPIPGWKKSDAEISEILSDDGIAQVRARYLHSKYKDEASRRASSLDKKDIDELVAEEVVAKMFAEKIVLLERVEMFSEEHVVEDDDFSKIAGDLVTNKEVRAHYLEMYATRELASFFPIKIIWKSLLKEILGPPGKRSDYLKFAAARMNQMTIPLILAVLCDDTLESKGEKRETIHMNTLEKVIANKITKSPGGAIKGYGCGVLQAAGYISGYEWWRISNKPYSLRITNKGVNAYLRYLAKCQREYKDVDEQLRSIAAMKGST